MKTLTVINDLHIGAIRTGGTTPSTAAKLRLNLSMGYNNILTGIDNDLLINGDLFDKEFIPMSDLLDCYNCTVNWLQKGYKLVLVAGNHDLSKSSLTLSSFQFFCRLLTGQYPDQVTAVFGAMALPEYDAYVISHVPNQDLLDMELAKVPACKHLFLHCNYDNHFAEKSDHSLNLSEDQAKVLPVEKIIFGHEHQAKTALNGKVVIVGNQLPSSVSDCLGNEYKKAYVISALGMQPLSTWHAAGSFSEQDWRSLEDRGDFIRVTGTATADEAGAVVAAVSKFRSSAKALVITNAVQIAGMEDSDQIEVSLEQIRGFSVMDALLEYLTPEEGAVITKLQKDYSVH